MKRQSGFTLIELVIVIIVLGILSATALPKFLDLQSDARKGAMDGLKAALETAVTLTYTQAIMEGKTTANEDELSSGIQVRYGYPQAEQSTSLDLIVDLSDDDWNVTAASNSVNFTFMDDTDDMTSSEIDESSIVCKLTYTQSVYDTSTKTAYRPVISISGTDCTD